MRLFGKPGGTRGQFRAAFQTLPFDRAFASPAAVPDAVFRLGARGTMWKIDSRGTVWQLAPRGSVFVLPGKVG